MRYAAAILALAVGTAGAPARAEGIARHSFSWLRTAGGAPVLAVTVEPEPGWHVYWENPGDSGDAPRFELTLPPGWQAAEPVYQRPEVGLVDGAPFYGHHGRATYLVPVAALPPAPGAPPMCGNGRWKATVRVMACKERCTVTTLTGGGDWPVVTEGEPVELDGGTVDGASLPMSADKAGVTARIDGKAVVVEGPAGGAASVRFVPSVVPGMEVELPPDAPSVTGTVADGRFRLELRLKSPGVGQGNPVFAGLVLLGNGRGDPCVRLAVPPSAASGASGAAPPSN